MRWRVVVRQTLVVSSALVAIGIASVLVTALFRFDGRCGGFMPFLAAPTPCGLPEYLGGILWVTLLFAPLGYWPYLVAAVVCVFGVCSVAEARGRRARSLSRRRSRS